MEAKFRLPPSSGKVWCQRWNTGVASTYFSGPSVQLRLACTNSAIAVCNGTMNRSAAGDTPTYSMITSAR